MRERPFLRTLTALMEAAGVVLAVPFLILIVCLPVVLAVRGIAEAVGWLLARF